jgi:hypothetical protein
MTAAGGSKWDLRSQNGTQLIASARGFPYEEEYEKKIVKRMQKKLSESVRKHPDERTNTGLRDDDRDMTEVEFQVSLDYTQV